MEQATPHSEAAPGPVPDTLAPRLPLPLTVLVTEAYLEVKCNADHEVPENCQKGADQVFL